MDGYVEELLLRHTKAELLEIALEHRLPLAPLRGFDEVRNDPSLATLFTEVERPDTGPIARPGRPTSWPTRTGRSRVPRQRWASTTAKSTPESWATHRRRLPSSTGWASSDPDGLAVHSIPQLSHLRISFLPASPELGPRPAGEHRDPLSA